MIFSKNSGFTDADVSDLSGRTFLITGANTGIGFETARIVARNGARVLLACRSREKAQAAREKIISGDSNADVAVVEIDLGSLDSVRAAAEAVNAERRLDVVVNNAGIMMPPFELTTDGFESQFGTNHLGPFALTGLLLPKLLDTEDSRVVSTSSIAHRNGKIFFDDLNAKNGYNAMRRYQMSKLANLMFALELHRRLSRANARTISVACHPGIATTELTRHLPRILQVATPLLQPLLNSPTAGAWPTLMAASSPEVTGGQYCAPSRRGETSGPAALARARRHAANEADAQRLWTISEELTGVRYSF